jgi:hypothetical protein
VTGWLDFSGETSGAPLASVEQLAFVRQVEELLDAAGAPGLDREKAFAGRWDDDLFGGALLIVLPLASSLHASIQLQMTSSQILGTWDDKHYLWDSTPDGGEALRVEGVDSRARARALAWLDHEIRRPVVRRDYTWGRLRHTTWEHTDDGEFSWSDARGLQLVRTLGIQCSEEPAGFLDPARVP